MRIKIDIAFPLLAGLLTLGLVSLNAVPVLAAEQAPATGISDLAKTLSVPFGAVPQHPARRLMLTQVQKEHTKRYKNGPRKWREYCARQAADCMVTARGMVLPFSPALWRTLQEVNEAVNTKMRYTPDPQNGQGVDKWVRPVLTARGLVAGDCEDYVLAKRHALLQRGLPAGALRFTLVARDRGAKVDHAVLVVATDFGDFVLDNLGGSILPVEVANYRYAAMHLPSRAAPHRFRYTLARPQPFVPTQPRLVVVAGL